MNLIGGTGWSRTLIIMSAVAALMLPLGFMMNPREVPAQASVGDELDAVAAARLALRTRDFWLLSVGFFVCGFHVVFISTHLPAYLSDNGLDAGLGSTSLALIGLFNIAGSLASGWLGSRLPKPVVLGGIYALRAVAIGLFLWLPLSAVTVLVFASAMGVLWLSTVPLTNGMVASMFGVKNLSMLTGFVFVAHQIGAFLGGWLGGLLYDRVGNYDVVWLMAVALSVLAVIMHVFIKERAVVPRT